MSTGVVGTEGTHHPSVTPLKGQERPGGTPATCSFCFASAGHNVKETHWSALLQCVLLTQVLGPQASVSRGARDKKTFTYHSCIACMDVTTVVFACLLILDHSSVKEPFSPGRAAAGSRPSLAPGGTPSAKKETLLPNGCGGGDPLSII